MNKRDLNYYCFVKNCIIQEKDNIFTFWAYILLNQASIISFKKKEKMEPMRYRLKGLALCSLSLSLYIYIYISVCVCVEEICSTLPFLLFMKDHGQAIQCREGLLLSETSGISIIEDINWKEILELKLKPLQHQKANQNE